MWAFCGCERTQDYSNGDHAQRMLAEEINDEGWLIVDNIEAYIKTTRFYTINFSVSGGYHVTRLTWCSSGQIWAVQKCIRTAQIETLSLLSPPHSLSSFSLQIRDVQNRNGLPGCTERAPRGTRSALKKLSFHTRRNKERHTPSTPPKPRSF